MAMTKGEMENHLQQYQMLMSKARLALKERRYIQAVEIAVTACDHIDGMMQYERKYNDKEFSKIEAIEIVTKFAPLLFDFHALEKLEALLKTQKRIEKNSEHDLVGNLGRARALMLDAHRLWNHVEKHPGCFQDALSQSLGGDHTRWQTVAELLEGIGVIHRKPEGGSCRLTFSTRFDVTANAKCRGCGALVTAERVRFLSKQTCPKCGVKEVFVILSSTRVADP
jgi:hypothetical protein